MPEDAIHEAIADLISEIFTEPELEEAANGNGEEENSEYIEEASLQKKTG